MIGKTLAHYKVTSLLGKGGMGEVYRATDTKLGRDVALKILPQEMSGDPERAARFQREARSLALLQHPNVASIYGFEEVEGVRFLVMELVEGEDLSELLAKGKPPLEEARRIARQIAEGLAAAHEKGIVHRDLKPANVMLSPEGDIKILDFGLARAWFGDGADNGDIETSPTITAAMTQAGTILGTAAYMSPEQARGRPVDQRADVWAFGVILWELLVGRKLFDGGTISDTLAAVLRVEPDLDQLPDELPRGMRPLLRRCLQKDRRQRMHSMADVALMLDELGELAAEGHGSTPLATPSASRWRWVPWVVAVLAIAALARETTREVSEPEPLRGVRFSLETPEPIHAANAGTFTLSPDGQLLALTLKSETDNRSHVWIRHLDTEGFQLVEGVSDARIMGFSPDSQWLLVADAGNVVKVRVSDGSVVQLASGGARSRAAWRDDGTIVYTQNYASGLYRIPEGGGTPEQLTTPSSGELGHWYPEAIPGSRYVLYCSYSTPIDSARIMALDVEKLSSKVVMQGGSDPRYSTTGHLLFLRNGQLLAAPFDARSAEVTGATVPVLTDVTRGSPDGQSALDLSDDGTLVWIHASEYAVPRELVRLTPQGQLEELDVPARQYGNPRISPDGRSFVVIVFDGDNDLWLQDLRRGTFTRFTFGATMEMAPQWSSDGSTIYFAADSPQFVIYERPTSGSTPAEVLLEVDVDVIPNDVTADGKYLIYQRSEGDTAEDLWMLPLEGGDPQLLVRTPYEELGAEVSPNGRWMSYSSLESGRQEIYIRSFPDMNQRVQVSEGGGSDARWTADGSGLTYLSSDGFMRVSVEDSSDELEIGDPVVLYAGNVDGAWGSVKYDTIPDGSGWMFTRVPAGQKLRSLHVETGWAQRVLGAIDR